MPPEINGSTYSHFVVQVKNRSGFLKEALRKGLQLGWIIEYSNPELMAYGQHQPPEFPIAAKYARSVINLPVWGGNKLAQEVLGRLPRGI